MPAKRNRTKKTWPDPNYIRPSLEEETRGRRSLCTALKFCSVCLYSECRRARRCARASNDCFEHFWPLVPERMKIMIRAAGEAHAAGLSKPEVRAAIERAQARWDETQASFARMDAKAGLVAAAPASESQPVAPPRRIAAPAPPNPRLRVL